MITIKQWEKECEDLRQIRYKFPLYYKYLDTAYEVEIIRKPINEKEVSIIRLKNGIIIKYTHFLTQKSVKSNFLTVLRVNKLQL